jgi:uncharacterized protein YprB with RNaseH-like and TPR domain
MDWKKLKKDDFLWLATHRCKAHGVLYIEHPKCFEREHPEAAQPSAVPERIGFLDIETSNLDANFGIILTYCIKVREEDTILCDTITKDDIANNEFDKPDKRLVAHLIEDMSGFDRLVAHYGERFDLKYIRTRALYLGLPFFDYGELNIDDTWVMAKNKLKLNSNRLGTVAEALFGHTDKNAVSFKYWIGAMHADEESLAYILDHNKRDVLELEKVWEALKDMIKRTKHSI